MPLDVLIRFTEPFPFAVIVGDSDLRGNVRLDLFGRQLVLPALLGQRHQLLDVGPQFLGLGQSGHDTARHLGTSRVVLVLVKCPDQAACHIADHGAAMSRTSAEFPASHSMSHRSVCVRGLRQREKIRRALSWPLSCPSSSPGCRAVHEPRPGWSHQSSSPSAVRPQNGRPGHALW